ncbi:MAG TPA: hypothetical protein VJV58_22175 [Bradyrhizobium sp.]|uniref:hypothetical protein n=1 Tax=Bradyrhizobium sp. TaxID=376 RepID=UPI002B4A11D6|nr:hypothetical protein [Bradyrhizobium sp.]HKO73646.1 hypothetical protein [Bradyrhizobium sp.]
MAQIVIASLLYYRHDHSFMRDSLPGDIRASGFHVKATCRKERNAGRPARSAT